MATALLILDMYDRPFSRHIVQHTLNIFLNNHYEISSIEMKQCSVTAVIHSLILHMVRDNGNCQALLTFLH